MTTHRPHNPPDRASSAPTRTGFASWLEDGTVVCPDCHGRLELSPAALACTDCRRRFPVHEGIPALFSPRSAFAAVADIDDTRIGETPPNETPDEMVDPGRGTYFATKLGENPTKRRLRRMLPTLAKDHGARRVDTLVRRAVAAHAGAPLTGLVVGAGERPDAIAARFPEVTWLASDVDAGYGPTLLADVQDLPVATGAVDVVLAEMVLEHVMNPVRAAAELERVVRPGGLLMITVPFCFPWHGIPIDFFRCTPSGLRALFRHVEVMHLDRGMGPWGGVAYALDAALTNLTGRRLLRRMIVVLSRFAFGGLAVLDRLRLTGGRSLVNPASLTLVGRRTTTGLTDAELLMDLRARFGHGPGERGTIEQSQA